MEKTIPVHIKKSLEETHEGFNFSALPFKTQLSFEPILKFWQSKVDGKNLGIGSISQSVIKRIKDIEALRGPITDRSQLEAYDEEISILLSALMPHGLQDSELSYITSPFSLDSIRMTNALSKKLDNAHLEFKFKAGECRSITNLVIKACTLILDKVYGYNHFLDLPMVFSMVDNQRKTTEYYKSIINLDFVEVVALEEVEPPSEQTVQMLLRNLNNADLWVKAIQPEKFEFRGVVKANLIDVTEEEALSRMKYMLLEKNALVFKENLVELQQLVRDFFRKDTLQLGITAIDYPTEYAISHTYKIRHDLLSDAEPFLLAKKNEGSVIHRAMEAKECMVVDDMEHVENPTDIERKYRDRQINSVILAPLRVGDRVLGLLEIGTNYRNCFSSLDRIKINELIPLFTTSIERSRDEIDNQIDAIIREQYTAIHPSIEWKFIEVAYNLMEQRESDPYGAKPEPIVFQDVIPLYAQSDISRSSNIRNRAIQHDLIENLNLALAVVDDARGKMDLPIINHYANKINTYKDSISLGINSNDEVQIIEFVKSEIGPLFNLIREVDKSLDGAIKNYESELDPDLGIVYRERKSFENSVALINDTISSYLEMKEDEAQKIIPHYFEKYKTDGVEFDMYFGQSLLNSGKFYPMHMRNMRLWQLIIMCDIARIVHGLRSRLPIPLQTAELVLVHSNPLSIRFRADEKRFDVDGTYNVRYEIIKKRIDKAQIMGTTERLTKPGTVSIVYTQERDRTEYEDYIAHLVEQKYIKPDYDHVILERTQGVEGLKAFRLYVNFEVDNHPAHSESEQILKELIDPV